jgi:RHS repeat-associated protein
MYLRQVLLTVAMLCSPIANAAVFTVANTADTGAGSLNQAIQDANTNAGANTIAFNIPGGGGQIIEPYTWLPVVTNQVTIDGTTQPGYAGAPLIVLNGDNGIDAITISAPGCAIKGLAFGGFGQAYFLPSACLLLLSASNTVTACHVGISETYPGYNLTDGILISNAPGNVIGGLTVTDRNLIGGNLTGVFITGANASNNVILGNWFSLSQDGSTTLVNENDITISNAPNNTIGGDISAARNVLDGWGLDISSPEILVNGGATSNAILGNYLNLFPNGSPATNDKGRVEDGIVVWNATGTVIGGTTAGARNIISGCGDAIVIFEATTSGTVVQGNYLGTDPTGMTADFNYEGVSIEGSSGNLIGGTAPGAGNVIVGEGIAAVTIEDLVNYDYYGVVINEGASNNVVQGNFIGTDASGMNALLNNGTLTDGVGIFGTRNATTGNLIGGLTPGAGNVISGWTADGVQINGATASNNIVQGNFIGVAADGVTALGNAANGVDMYGANSNWISGNVIGNNGTSGAAGVFLFYATNNLVISNTIYSNMVSGVTMIAGPNVISENSIYGNGGLGIDNGSHVLTANSPEGNSNYPILTSARQGSTIITGTFNGTPNCTYKIEFFWNPPGSDTAGQAQSSLGSTYVTTDGNGNATIQEEFTTVAPAGSTVTADATATCPGPHETSQLSLSVFVITSESNDSGAPTTSAEYHLSGTVGHPVDTFNGELFDQLSPDLELGGPMPLRFQRYYAAFLKKDGLIAGKLGDNWLHNFEMTLAVTASNTVNIVNNQGRLIPFTNNAGNFILLGRQDVPYQLATNGSSFILGDPVSQRLYTFDSSGNLITIADGHGNAQTLIYVSGLLAAVADGLGRSLIFAYNNGLLSGVSDGTRLVQFVQTGNNLTSATDALGFVTTYSYDPTNALSGLMIAATEPQGNVPFAQVFNANGQVLTQTEAGTNVTSLSYSNNTTTITDPIGNVRVDVHTTTGELASFTDESGQTITLGSNPSGQRNLVTDRLGQTTLISYLAPSGKPAALTNADGTVMLFNYAPRANSGVVLYDLSQAIYPDGTMESFTYDASGNVLTHTDRAGEVFSFTYNSRGQVLTAANPIGGVASFTYDTAGRLATRIDSDTGLTTFQYDSLSRLTNVIHPDGTTLQSAFDANDRLLSLTDERNNITTFSYDQNNRLVSVTDADSQVTHFAYDSRDRPVQVTDRLGKTLGFSYDTLDHVATVTNRNGNVTIFTYDSRQRLASVTDPGGKLWGFGYDNEAIPASSTNPLGQTDSQAVNPLGYPVTFTNALGQVSSVARDSMQRTTNAVDEINRTNSFGYEARGLLANTTAPLIGTATYQRNNLGLLSGITGLNGEQWNFAYTPMGRLQSLADPLNRTNVYSYDNRGRLQQTAFADGVLCSDSYDQASNPTGRQYSGGPALQFTYDSLNRLASANDLSFAYDAEGRVTNTLSSGVNQGAAYDADGRLTSITCQNGALSVNYAYDSRDRLTQVSDTLTGTQISFNYDDAGRLTGITRPNGVNGTYTYDAAGRLTRIQEGAIIDLQYGYDAAGEITNANFTAPLDPATLLTPTLSAFAYDAAHQIKNSGYAFDARGRQTASPGHSYQWDGASRLVGIDGVAMAYNGTDDIETRTAGGVTTRFFYNHALGLTPIMAERNETSVQVQRYYVWTPGGRLLYMINATNGNAVSYYHFDSVGSTLALTTAAGAVTDAYAYSPYGVLLGHTGTSPQPFTYVGEYGVRGETAANLYHMRARYYDPASTRFLTRDAPWPRLADPRELNPYQYVSQRPLAYVDPTGRTSDRSIPHNEFTQFAYELGWFGERQSDIRRKWKKEAGIDPTDEYTLLPVDPYTHLPVPRNPLPLPRSGEAETTDHSKLVVSALCDNPPSLCIPQGICAQEAGSPQGDETSVDGTAAGVIEAYSQAHSHPWDDRSALLAILGLPTPSESGYWLAGGDGRVFHFGSVHFYGSATGSPLGFGSFGPIVNIPTTPGDEDIVNAISRHILGVGASIDIYGGLNPEYWTWLPPGLQK